MYIHSLLVSIHSLLSFLILLSRINGFLGLLGLHSRLSLPSVKFNLLWSHYRLISHQGRSMREPVRLELVHALLLEILVCDRSILAGIKSLLL